MRPGFRFAPIQGEYGRGEILSRGGAPDDLDTMYVLTQDGRTLVRARAWLFVLREIGGIWRWLRFTIAWLPTRVLDSFYGFVVRRRHRLSGRLDACPAPGPGDRAKFPDSESGGAISPRAAATAPGSTPSRGSTRAR